MYSKSMKFSIPEEVVVFKYTVAYCEFSPTLVTCCCSPGLIFLKSKEHRPSAWWSWGTERLNFIPVCLQGVLVNFSNSCSKSLCPELL